MNLERPARRCPRCKRVFKPEDIVGKSSSRHSCGAWTTEEHAITQDELAAELARFGAQVWGKCYRCGAMMHMKPANRCESCDWEVPLTPPREAVK